MRWKRSQKQVTKPGTALDPGWISQRHGIELDMTGKKKKESKMIFNDILIYS